MLFVFSSISLCTICICYIYTFIFMYYIAQNSHFSTVILFFLWLCEGNLHNEAVTATTTNNSTAWKSGRVSLTDWTSERCQLSSLLSCQFEERWNCPAMCTTSSARPPTSPTFLISFPIQNTSGTLRKKYILRLRLGDYWYLALSMYNS